MHRLLNATRGIRQKIHKERKSRITPTHLQNQKLFEAKQKKKKHFRLIKHAKRRDSII